MTTTAGQPKEIQGPTQDTTYTYHYDQDTTYTHHYDQDDEVSN
jgi:hypothetical protein